MSTERSAERELLEAFERHDPGRLRALLQAGASATEPVGDRSPAECLVEFYTRSDRFADCLRALLEHGATLGDPALEAVLLDDRDALDRVLDRDPSALHRRVSLRCAFTPLRDASLLHVAAEYVSTAVARRLLERGVPVDDRAGLDEFGLGGHTPLFHTLNSNADRARPLRELLLDAGARTDVPVAGLTWGEGCPWETTLFDLTPLSYAQCGLLPQFHRDPRETTEILRALLRAAGRPVPPLANVPNRYLA